MGFLDSLFGKGLPKPKIDDIFAMSTAYVTLDTNLNLKSDSRAGICFKPMESSHFASVEADLRQLIQQSCKETNTQYRIERDSYGYTWIILNDQNFEDLVSTIYMVSQTLKEEHFGEQLLCAVFKFRGETDVYWIYNFKQGKFYPFVPKKDRQRDMAYEFRLRAVMEGELPIEKELERWYPMWDLPL